jgi:diguanylate cyclase (GGDEF)-like protein
VTAVSSWFSGHDDELSLRARSSGLAIAVVALLAVPAWGGFDLLLEPDHARTFILLRFGCEIPLLGMVWLLWLRPVGRRYPELLTCLVLAVVQFEIAWMVVRATQARDFYLLGFSLALYGSGCLMGGRPRWTGMVVATTWLALGVALLTAPHPLSTRDLAAAGFYLATASIIGFVGHVQRERLSTRERMARLRLEREQDHTSELLARLERLSHEDPLTGVANRRRWDAALELACATARSNGSAISVVLIDIDRFKDVNDRHGHHGGDQTLREVAVLLTSLVRHNDLVARLGGDEYGVLLLDTNAVGAAEVAEKLRAEASRLRSLNPGSISLSLGVAAAAGGEALPDQLMKRADGQLYRAKATRNAVAV